MRDRMHCHIWLLQPDDRPTAPTEVRKINRLKRPRPRNPDRQAGAPLAEYHCRDRLTIATTESITGTSTSTPTTVANAAPDSNPNRLIAAATASSKKLDA